MRATDASGGIWCSGVSQQLWMGHDTSTAGEHCVHSCNIFILCCEIRTYIYIYIHPEHTTITEINVADWWFAPQHLILSEWTDSVFFLGPHITFSYLSFTCPIIARRNVKRWQWFIFISIKVFSQKGNHFVSICIFLGISSQCRIIPSWSL